MHGRSLTAGVRHVVRTMGTWRERRRSRVELDRLGRHMLQDVGLAPDRAAFEADRPFWQS